MSKLDQVPQLSYENMNEMRKYVMGKGGIALVDIIKGEEQWLVVHPDIAKKIRSHPLAQASFLDIQMFTATGFGGNNVLTQHGPVHRTSRGLLHADFTYTSIGRKKPQIASLIRNELAKIDYSKPVEMVEILKLITAKVISEVILGISDESNEMKVLTHKVAILESLLGKLFQSSDNLPRALLLITRINTVTAPLRNFLRRQLDKAKTDNSGKQDVLHTLANHGDYDTRRIVNELMLMFFAGHETSSTQLFKVLYDLLKHPEYLERVESEIRNPNNDDKYPILHNAILESGYRLGSPTFATYRSIVEDCEITDLFGNTVVIPKGAKIQIDNDGINMGLEWVYNCQDLSAGVSEGDLEEYTQVLNNKNFDPDRLFSNPKFREWFERHNQVFGGDDKLCLGIHLAKEEVKRVLIEFLRQFDVNLLNPEEIKTEVEGVVKSMEPEDLRLILSIANSKSKE